LNPAARVHALVASAPKYDPLGRKDDPKSTVPVRFGAY
jgi:hypothetical protein